MQKDDEIRLSHMLSAAQEAQAFVRNETRASIEKDRKLILALVKPKFLTWYNIIH